MSDEENTSNTEVELQETAIVTEISPQNPDDIVDDPDTEGLVKGGRLDSTLDET
jgi:hypothetical protein